MSKTTFNWKPSKFNSLPSECFSFKKKNNLNCIKRFRNTFQLVHIGLGWFLALSITKEDKANRYSKTADRQAITIPRREMLLVRKKRQNYSKCSQNVSLGFHGPRQGPLSQLRYSSESPEQPCPPFWALIHRLRLIIWPTPHDTLQGSHDDQASQVPSAGRVCSIMTSRCYQWISNRSETLLMC